MLSLFLAVSVSAQQKVKKNMKGAIAAASLSKDDAKKVKKIMADRRAEIKIVREKGLDKKAEWKEIKAIKAKYEGKITEAIGKEKAVLFNQYWKRPKKNKKKQ